MHEPRIPQSGGISFRGEASWVVYRQESAFFLVPGREDVDQGDDQQGEKPAHTHIGQRDMPAGGSGTPTGITMVQAMAIVKRIDVGSREALRDVGLTPPVDA